MDHSSDRATFDDLGLSALDLSGHPDLRYLSAQGNRLRRLNLAEAPGLSRLLLFDNRFDRRGVEGLLNNLAARGDRDGFLGVSSLWKQSLSLSGRVDLAVLRSRNWSIPMPGFERTFGLQASVYCWEPESIGRREADPVWSFVGPGESVEPRALPAAGFVDDAPRWFYVTDPNGFYDVTSIDLSNKGLVGKAGLQAFPSLFRANLSINDLRSVDLSENRWLTGIDLRDNGLVAIDLSGNPELEELRLGNNDLASVDLSRNRRVIRLDLSYNRLSSEAVDHVLETLVAHGRAGGEVLLDGGGNEAPTARGRGASWVLGQRAWRVAVNPELDFDLDGLGDAWEIEVFGGIHEDDKGDADGDGLSNLRERLRYLDPSNADSDGDGFSDGAEVAVATDPLDPEDMPPSNGVLEGVVWDDVDRDLVREDGEAGIPRIKVFLVHGTGTDRRLSHAITADDGSYRFTGLEAGRYSIAIDWNAWKPLGPTVLQAVLGVGEVREAIDFALFNPAVSFTQWTERHFGQQRFDPSADPDGDGYPNLLEYALGTRPLVSNGRGLPQVEALGEGNSFRVSLRYSIDRHATDARTVAEVFAEGEWRELTESAGRNDVFREVSIPVDFGKVGLIRLRTTLVDQPQSAVSSPWWGGHALFLEPGTRTAGLPLVNSRLFGSRVLRNDATSVFFANLDLPLSDLLGDDRSYLEVVEGAFEGERWEVAGVQPFADRLSLAVDHAANTRVGALPDLTGCKVVVRSHFSLGQVFGRPGERILNTSFLPHESDRLWFLESGRLTPYHFASSEDGSQTLGWSRWADLNRFWGKRPIFPGEGFFAQRLGETGIGLFVVGEARLNRMVMPLRHGVNFMAVGFPSEESLFGLGLSSTRGVTAGRRPENSTQAFFWNGRGFDSYYLFTERSKRPRWVRIGDTKSIDKSSLPLIGEDEGFFLDMVAPRRLRIQSIPIGLR